MANQTNLINRRRIFGAGAASMALWTVPGAFAEQLARTPDVEEGPFYPNKLLADTDNDLLILNNAITPAVGEITHLSGKLLDARGEPVRNAQIEIWQVDNNGTYLKMHTSGDAKWDANFQGFGRFLTSSTGEYYFRTIKPVPYSGRPAPHIHFKIKTAGHAAWTTQIFIKGHPGNARDRLYRNIGDAAMRDRVTFDFAPIAKSPNSDLAVKFDIVLGWTPKQ